MDKFQVAHEWVMSVIHADVRAAIKGDLCELAWKYADEMQAEADKRKEKGMPDVLKSNEHNWENVTVMGDNVAKFVCADCGAVKHDVLERQPDWSVAPSWANWWAFDGLSKKANWFKIEPYLDDDSLEEGEWDISDTYEEAPSFNYQGDWRNSLRKRPQ